MGYEPLETVDTYNLRVQFYAAFSSFSSHLRHFSGQEAAPPCRGPGCGCGLGS